MRVDYDNLSWPELDVLYFETFGECFAVAWDDDSDHRDEIIACIEAGIPQAKDENYPWTNVPDGCVA